MHYETIFQPLQVKKYNHDVNRLTGRRFALFYGLIHEAGPYEEQRCIFIPKATIGWIPEGDLLNLRPVYYSKWQETHESPCHSC
jgi:hypothetical protein